MTSPFTGNVWVTLIALFSAVGSFLFGLDIGYIAAIIECPSFKREVGHLSNWSDPQASLDGTTVGFIVGIFSLGCVLTSFPVCSGFFLDTLGRRPSITLGSAIFLVGCGAQASAKSVAQFMAGRLVAGCSIGLLSTVVACYQSELAPPALRGALTGLYQLMITFGILVATLLDYLLVGQDGGWRIAIGLQAIPAVCLLLGTTYMPRSPRWLVQNGRREEALQVLSTVRSNDAAANDELQEIIDSVEVAQAMGEPRWIELCKGRLGGMLAVGVGMQLLQQLCGMNAFMYFGPRIFQEAHLDPLLFQTAIVGVNFLATLPAIFLVDSFGRRALMCWGAGGMMVTCLAMGSVSFFTAPFLVSSEKVVPGLGQSPSARHVVVAMSFCFVINFAYSWGPCVWVYMAEMFPLRHRGRCMGITTTANWVGNYFIAQFTPVMLQTLGFGTFFVFAFFSGICLMVALWLPETKGLVLEKVGELFDAKLGFGKVCVGKDAEKANREGVSLAQNTLNGNYGAADAQVPARK